MAATVADIRPTLNFSHSVLNSSVGLLGGLALWPQVNRPGAIHNYSAGLQK